MTGLILGVVTIGIQHASLLQGQQSVRPAAVAGSFYPADPVTLTGMMDQMLARAKTPALDGSIVAVVAPHAGYEYSGPVAAYTYAALKGRKYARVVVIAPSHFEMFAFSSVFEGDAYQTPLGVIPVDKAFAVRLAKMDSSIRLSEHGHGSTTRGGEHALEVQLPWLQTVLGDFTLVPIIMGDQSYASSRALGVSLSKLISQSGEDTLIVASSDLSHYLTYEQAQQIDHRTLNALEHWDYLSMSRNFAHGIWEACGGGPIVAAMIAADHMGARRAVLLDYATSGDVTGDRSHVVGYGAVALLKDAHAGEEEEKLSLSDQDKQKLLALARSSVERAVVDPQWHETDPPPAGVLSQNSGAFVTITKAGELRGCIGYTDPVAPLYQVVSETAILAASRDPRFPPVSARELPQLSYEISVLSPLRRAQDLREIRVGTHGILIKNGKHEGLLLPQVATTQHWDRITFLNHTCVKAGMPEDCWKDPDSDVFLFRAVVFGDQPTSRSPQSPAD